MPWSPSPDSRIANPRIAAYHWRAAEFGPAWDHVLLIQPESRSSRKGGHLWWSRWGPFEDAAMLWIQSPSGDRTDVRVDPDDLDAVISEWERDEFLWLGVTHPLRWLDEETSRRIRQDFGLDD